MRKEHTNIENDSWAIFLILHIIFFVLGDELVTQAPSWAVELENRRMEIESQQLRVLERLATSVDKLATTADKLLQMLANK